MPELLVTKTAVTGTAAWRAGFRTATSIVGSDVSKRPNSPLILNCRSEWRGPHRPKVITAKQLEAAGCGVQAATLQDPVALAAWLHDRVQAPHWQLVLAKLSEQLAHIARLSFSIASNDVGAGACRAGFSAGVKDALKDGPGQGAAQSAWLEAQEGAHPQLAPIVALAKAVGGGILNCAGQLLSAIQSARSRSKQAGIELISPDTAWHSRLGGADVVAALQTYRDACVQNGIDKIPLTGYLQALRKEVASEAAKEAAAAEWLHGFMGLHPQFLQAAQDAQATAGCTALQIAHRTFTAKQKKHKNLLARLI